MVAGTTTPALDSLASLTVENAFAAFSTALGIGVSTLECDVNISADGVPMVAHAAWSVHSSSATPSRLTPSSPTSDGS